MKTISIVAPNGTRIADGIKTLEVRSWIPDLKPDEDLLVVENNRYLTVEGDVDLDSRAVALVRVARVRAFEKDDISAACATRFAEGYYSWELTHVRKIQKPIPVLAKRGLYHTDFSNLSGASHIGTNTEDYLHFRLITRSDFPLLLKWLAEAHVKEWWHDDLDAKAIEAKYGPRVDGLEPTHVYIILQGTKPIGLIQWYLWSNYPEHAAQLGANNSTAGMDLAIGEKEAVGRGIGSAVIQEFVTRVIFMESDATAVITDPEEQNYRSLRAFEKAGFSPLRKTQLQGEDFKRIVVGKKKALGDL